jgi:tetratricopeptide (TPR) repeat protein
MLKDPDFYTVTMARVYENQGLWDKAAEIYQYLLKEEPDRKDLAEALSKVERKMEEAIHKKPDDLIPLFHEWINLLLQYNRLQELRRFKGKLGV